MKKNTILYLTSLYILIVFGYRFFFASSFHNWQLDILGYAYVTLLIFNLFLPTILSLLDTNTVSWTGGFSKKTLKISLIASFVGFLVIAIGFDICFSNGYNDRTWPGSIIVTLFAFLALMIVHYVLRKKHPIIKVKTQTKGLILAVIFALITLIIGTIYHETYPKLISLLNAIFIVALLEEYLFRGFFQTQLLKLTSKSVLIFKAQLPYAILIQGFLFGLIHVLVNAPPFEWLYGTWTIPMGILFGVLTYKTGNIWLAFVIHAILGSLPILMS